MTKETKTFYAQAWIGGTSHWGDCRVEAKSEAAAKAKARRVLKCVGDRRIKVNVAEVEG